jgi:hypothetical protein
LGKSGFSQKVGKKTGNDFFFTNHLLEMNRKIPTIKKIPRK